MLEQTYSAKVVVKMGDMNGTRLLPFSGAKNFRDLGGYRTADGRTVRWGMLFRSDGLHKLTDSDLKFFSTLTLDRVIDFRAEHEKQKRPDRFPADANIQLVEIPIADSSTRVWHDSRDDMVKNLKKLDPAKYMTETNVELATRFTPEFRKFIQEVISAQGKPVLFHCAAGKDRTGFAAAIILRILGVPQETVMQDYLLTNEYLIPGYKWSLFLMQLLRGKRFVDNIKGFMSAHPSYLSAAFDAIDREHGSFENYVQNGLGLNEQDVERLKTLYVE